MEVAFKEGLADEVAVEEHFEEVVGVVVVENYSLSVPAGIVGHVVDGATPHPDQLSHVAGQLTQMVDVFE